MPDPISDETIETWEEKYKVDIRYDAEDGTFTVQSLDVEPTAGGGLGQTLETEVFGRTFRVHTPEVDEVDISYDDEGNADISVSLGGSPEEHGRSLYKVSGQVLDEEITLSPRYAEAVGVESTGDMIADLKTIGAAEFEAGGGMAVLEERHPNFSQTPLHRIACVAGALRSGGQIPPEVFEANPSFGGSGAGPDLIPGGGQGGGFSEVGIPHDIDMLLGTMGHGPMKELEQVMEHTGRVPSGLHGLGSFVEHAAKLTGAENYPAYIEEREAVPATADFPDYFRAEVDSQYQRDDGWDVQMDPPEKIAPENRLPGAEGPQAMLENDRVHARFWKEAYVGYVDRTGDVEGGSQVLAMTEDRNADILASALKESGTSLEDLLRAPDSYPTIAREADAEYDYGLG